MKRLLERLEEALEAAAFAEEDDAAEALRIVNAPEDGDENGDAPG